MSVVDDGGAGVRVARGSHPQPSWAKIVRMSVGPWQIVLVVLVFALLVEIAVGAEELREPFLRLQQIGIVF